MQIAGSPVQGMNRMIAVDKVKLDLGGKHTEANSLTQAMGPQSQYLGLMKLWDQYEYLNLPIISATELSKNVLYTNTLGETLSYSVRTKYALPYTTADVNGDDVKLGLNKEAFYLVLNTGAYTKGDTLTYDELGEKQAYVDVEEQENPVPYGPGTWLYKMRLTDADPKAYISRQWVQPGVEWIKIGSNVSEWSTELSAITNDSDGLETLQFKTGQTRQGVEHWVTGMADIIEYKTNSSEMDMSVMGKYKDPRQAAVMYLFDTLRDQTLPNEKATKVPVPNSGSWMPMILFMLYKEQAKMMERHYMYSNGGTFVDGRGTIVRRGMGYYPQLKSSSNYHTFQKPEQLGPLVRQTVGDLFSGRRDLAPHERRVRLKMGAGAIVEMQKYFLANFQQDIRFPIWGQHDALRGMLTGDNMHLSYGGFRFTSYLFPETGLIEIVHDPALDWSGTKNQNGFVGNYSTYSYRVFVEDLTEGAFSNAMPPGGIEKGAGFDNGGNITLIKPKNYAEVYTSYTVGDYCPDFLRAFVGAGANAHIASSDKDGFGIRVKWAGEVWMKDPSRTILLEMKDPLRTL